MKIREIAYALLMWYIDLYFCLSNMFLTPQVTSARLRIIAVSVAVLIGIKFLSQGRYTASDYKQLLLPMGILLFFFPTFILYNDNSLATSSLQCFVCYAIPMTLLAMLANKRDTVLHAGDYAELVLLLFDIYMVFIFRHGIRTDINVRVLQESYNIGYQSTSYFGAYAFGLSLFILLFHRVQAKRKLLRTMIYLFRGGSLILSLLVAIYGSGRGAMVVIAVFIVTLGYLFLKENKQNAKPILALAVLVLAFMIVSMSVQRNAALGHSFDRIYALFGSGTISKSTTSGRNIIYARCFEAFLHSPIWGHGIGSAGGIGIGQPHQMFLEIMIEGGLLYLTIWIALLYRVVNRYFRILRMDPENLAGYIFLLLPFLAQFIGTQFSGFYLQNYSFWFFIAYVNLRYISLK